MFNVHANLRNTLGKGSSRRLRRNDRMVPAIIYGGNLINVAVYIELSAITKILESGINFSNIITISFSDKKAEPVLIKSLQRHPITNHVMHVDFLRIIEDHKIITYIPLKFIKENIAIGVTQDGGEISHTISEVEVSCFPKHLPEFIEVDMSNIKMGQTVHLSTLKVPKGVELIALNHGNDLAVSTIHSSRKENTEDISEETSS